MIGVPIFGENIHLVDAKFHKVTLVSRFTLNDIHGETFHRYLWATEHVERETNLVDP